MAKVRSTERRYIVIDGEWAEFDVESFVDSLTLAEIRRILDSRAR